MKRAVVLGGGGLKGSYEIGVWQALRELDTSYQIVTGTSVGAMNGALMAQGDYEEADRLWQNLRSEDIVKGGVPEDFSLDNVFNNIKKAGGFLKDYIENKGADISPLIELTGRMVDEKKLRSSAIDYGLVTVRYSEMKPVEITRAEIGKGKIADFVLASAACFPAFPMHEIDGEKYIDGGYYDNLPINLAIRMGAEEIIAVDLDYKKTHPAYRKMPMVTYISPSRSLGFLFDFSRETLDGNRSLGYINAMQAFGRLAGFRYGIRVDCSGGELGQKFAWRVASVTAVLEEKEDDFLLQVIEAYTDGKELSFLDFLIRGAENCMEQLEESSDKIYDLCEWNRHLRSRFHNVKRFEYQEAFKDQDKMDREEREYLIGCFYRMLLESEDIIDYKRAAYQKKEEFLAALYLDTLVKYDN